MQFEYHLTHLHFFGVKELIRKYGKKIILLSGQSCDSVLSFGPSQYTFSNFVARYIVHFPNSFLTTIFVMMLKIKFKRKIESISKRENYFKFFYYSFYYYALKFDNNKKYNYDNSLFKISKKLKNRISQMMFLKSHGFLQGPDNLVLIHVCKYFKLNEIILPYSTYRFKKIICENYNFFLDIFFPKYIIDLLLDNYYLIKIKNFIYRKTTKTRLSIIDQKNKFKFVNKIYYENKKRNYFS